MSVIDEEFYNRSMSLPEELLRDAIDTHIHAGPVLKSNPGRIDPFQAAEDAKNAGMKAVVFYDVFGTSSGTAWMVSRKVEGIHVFGGIILSSCQGGMNPRAVRTALYYGSGAKFVSFGAHCTHFQASREGIFINNQPVPFKDLYPEFNEKELSKAIKIPLHDPVPNDLDEILRLLAEHPDVYLNTGHLSGPEVLRLFELKERYGIQKFLVAHPARLQLTVSEQKELSKSGAFLEAALVDWYYPSAPRTHYYVEKEYMDRILYTYRSKKNGLLDWASEIKEVGIDNFILSTDYGIRAAPRPIEAFQTLIASMLDIEFSVEEIRKMTSVNPSRLLDL